FFISTVYFFPSTTLFRSVFGPQTPQHPPLPPMLIPIGAAVGSRYLKFRPAPRALRVPGSERQQVDRWLNAPDRTLIPSGSRRGESREQNRSHRWKNRPPHPSLP